MSEYDEVTRTATAALMSRRFRGFLPVVIDVETGGFNSRTDALLEIAAVFIDIDASGTLSRGATHSFHVQPFPGCATGPGLTERHGHRSRIIRCGPPCRNAKPSSASSAKCAIS